MSIAPRGNLKHSGMSSQTVPTKNKPSSPYDVILDALGKLTESNNKLIASQVVLTKAIQVAINLLDKNTPVEV